MERRGTNRSVEQLVDDHYQSLYRYAFRLCGSQAEAEDLTQEAFCQAQAKWRQLREWNRAKSWLFTILRNTFLHRLRARKNEAFVSVDQLGDVPDRLSNHMPEFSSEQLQAALNELPEEFRTPVILFYFEEFSYREIAEQMDVALGTVMSRLARAKSHLRARLIESVEYVTPRTGGERDGM